MKTIMQNTELSHLISELERKGIRYELYGKHTLLRVFEGTICETSEQYDVKIGIEIKSWVWAWFRVCDNRNDYYFFEQRYNMNTGKSIKSWRTGYRIVKMLTEKLR